MVTGLEHGLMYPTILGIRSANIRNEIRDASLGMHTLNLYKYTLNTAEAVLLTSVYYKSKFSATFI